jgi:hypothetical protein
MSRVIAKVKWATGFYSVGDRGTEVFPGRMKDRNNWSISSNVEISEVMAYAGYGFTREIGLTRIDGNIVGDHGKLFGWTNYQDCERIASIKRV